MYDIIIKNGTIIDGTGSAMFRADVGIKGDKIERIGELQNEKADRIIDAFGKIVCPGFIDVNNHSDTYWQIFRNPDLESLLYQGITTIVGGNCGSSIAPLADAKNIETIQKWIDINITNVNWLTVGELFRYLEERPIAINFTTLTGHATLRRGILNDEERSFTASELELVKKRLGGSMKDGSRGLSSGLIYTHARLASEDELVDFAKVVKKYDGVYTTHVRSENDDAMEAIEEAIRVSDRSGAKLHISHLKVMERKNWAKMDDILGLIEHARTKNGIDITFDVYPYTNTGSVLYSILPAWLSEGGRKMMLRRLKDGDMRKRLVKDMKESGFDWGQIEIAISPLGKTLARRKIGEIAKAQEKTAEEATIDVLAASDGRVITSMEVLSEENVRRAILHPLSIIASNGAGYNLSHAQSGEIVHPRCFGAFTKILEKYVKEEKVMRWEDAIAKMTSRPAEKFGLKDRGKIAQKCLADILILDAEALASPASVENPYQYSKGVDFMLINGNMVIEEGRYNGARKGHIVRNR